MSVNVLNVYYNYIYMQHAISHFSSLENLFVMFYFAFCIFHSQYTRLMNDKGCELCGMFW